MFAICFHTSEKLENICHKVFQIKTYSENKIINLLYSIDPLCKKSILIGSFFSEKLKNNMIISKRKNLSNSFKSIEKINNQEKFFETLKKININYPQWQKTPPKEFKNWIVKNSQSIGGISIKKYEKTLEIEKIKKNIYFQKIVEGKVMSAQFYVSSNKIILLSTCLQWLDPSKDYPFLLGGLITQKMTKKLINKITDTIKKISLAFDLNGLNSIDFIISKSNKLIILEINARPGLSINLLSKIYKENLFSTKLKYTEPKSFFASSIIYSKKKFIFSNKIKHQFNKIKYFQNISEVPTKNKVINNNDPICLIHGQSNTENETKKIIKELSKKVLSYTNS